MGVSLSIVKGIMNNHDGRAMKHNRPIVDDEKLLRRILVVEFLDEGFNIFEVAGGNEAFEIIKSEQIDIVLSDIRMPAGNGMELLEKSC